MNCLSLSALRLAGDQVPPFSRPATCNLLRINSLEDDRPTWSCVTFSKEEIRLWLNQTQGLLKVLTEAVYEDPELTQVVECQGETCFLATTIMLLEDVHWRVSDVFRSREGFSRPVEEAVDEDCAGHTRPNPHDDAERHAKVINQLEGLRGGQVRRETDWRGKYNKVEIKMNHPSTLSLSPFSSVHVSVSTTLLYSKLAWCTFYKNSFSKEHWKRNGCK